MADIRALLSSKSDRWFTPPDILAEVDVFYGVEAYGPYFDPCPALAEGEPVVDGLAIPWAGKAFMNAPFTRQHPITPWIKKALTEPVDEILMLVPSNTGTQWFKLLRDVPMLFIEGRLRFSNSRNTATFDSVLAYRGPRVASFVAVFGHRGVVRVPILPRDITNLGWPPPPLPARRVAAVHGVHAPLPSLWDASEERTA